MELVNEVSVRGRIIGWTKDAYGRNRLTIYINDNKQKPAYVKFVVDRDVDISGFEVKDHVRIAGFCRAYGFYNESLGKPSYNQYFVAQTIEKDTTELEEKFGMAGRYYNTPFFRMYTKGIVESIIDTGNERWKKLKVRTCSHGIDQRQSTITFSYYTGGDLPECSYKRGDIVCLSASVSTPQKDMNGQKVSFENLTIEDIVLAEDAYVPKVTEFDARSVS